MKGYSSSRDPLSLDINIEAEYPVIVDHDKMNNPILPLCT